MNLSRFIAVCAAALVSTVSFAANVPLIHLLDRAAQSSACPFIFNLSGDKLTIQLDQELYISGRTLDLAINATHDGNAGTIQIDNTYIVKTGETDSGKSLNTWIKQNLTLSYKNEVLIGYHYAELRWSDSGVIPQLWWNSVADKTGFCN